MTPPSFASALPFIPSSPLTASYPLARPSASSIVLALLFFARSCASLPPPRVLSFFPLLRRYRVTFYALRSTSFLPAANFRASFSRDTTPVGCREYTFIFVNFAFQFCGASETVLREPCPTWKCNFAEPNPPDTDAALNADATATN